MFSPKLVLFLIIACILGVSAMPQLHDITNSERFSLGLPPLRPRKLFDATRVDTAARSKRSVSPGTTFTCSGSSGGATAVCCQTFDVTEGTGCTYNVADPTSNDCNGSNTAACCNTISGEPGDYSASGCAAA